MTKDLDITECSTEPDNYPPVDEQIQRPPIDIPKIEILPNGIVFKSDLSQKEWEDAGVSLKWVHNVMPWLIGDWLNYGKAQYERGKYAQALGELGYVSGTLRNIAYVARQFELSRRRDKLTFGHHQTVAPLDPKEQDQWLDLAERKRLSIQELRELIKEADALVEAD